MRLKLILITLSFLSIKLNSMESSSTQETSSQIESEMPYEFNDLPEELKIYILQLTADGNYERAINSIRNIALVNKEFNTLIKNPNILGSIILKIVEKSELPLSKLSPIDIVDKLKFKSSNEWLKLYLSNLSNSKKIGLRILNHYVNYAIKTRDYNLLDAILTSPLIGSATLNGLMIDSFIAEDLKLIQTFVKNNLVDINYKNPEGLTALGIVLSPLFNQAEELNIEILKVLLSHPKIDVNYLDERMTSQETAKGTGRTDKILNFLIKNTEWGFEKKAIEVIKLLLENTDVDVNDKDLNGETPIELAQRKLKEIEELSQKTEVLNQEFEFYREIISLLKSKGAQ